MSNNTIAQYAPLARPALPDPKQVEAAQEFEAYMVSFLAQQMRATVPEGPFSGPAVQLFAGLLDQEIGRRVAEGGGLGLGAQLQRALSSQGLETAAPSPARGVAGRVSSAFGLRTDPIEGDTRAHHGVDLALPEGSPVHAARAGTVVFAGERGSYGNLVVVDHGDGMQTRYAHCRDLSVREGERVDAGAQLATVGSTGRSTGPHLHFEVRHDGRPVDPEAWLKR